MTVEIVHIVTVDTLAQIRHILIRGTHVDGVGTRQAPVDMIGSGCPCKQVDLERTPCGMLFLCIGSDSLGNALRDTGSRETRQCYSIAVLDKRGGFFRG